MPDRKVQLITGASSGVGQAAARLLTRSGYRVFGSSRNPASAEIGPAVEMVLLDVRLDDSVRAGVEAVFPSSGRLDVPINNAGYEFADTRLARSLGHILCLVLVGRCAHSLATVSVRTVLSQ